MRIGLRVDVDTLRGTRLGVPELLRILDRHSVQATFFFSVGPDNMGRHLWRLIKPAFFWKMLRTRAARLYGWDILLCGAFWPGPQIGERCRQEIKDTAMAGHEVGLHAWDHHAWQAHLDAMATEEIRAILVRGIEFLDDVVGAPPRCSASPGWRCNERVLEVKDTLPFDYNSDSRGTSIFRPRVGGRLLSQPQVPVTLPTYDEVVGRGGIDDASYNAHLLSILREDALNVLTIHAEAEGIVCSRLFDEFLGEAHRRGAELVPLRSLLEDQAAPEPGGIVAGATPGREGTLCCQAMGA